ncbi:MAG: dephospho-CoA kinase [Synechococcales cyanobacterium T60_A2020_003]|nr:dephospho-CoA kinase [Synechococcales cyanobacterium T60_A2020_003]
MEQTLSSSPAPQRIIGLTGGIGMGKSTVSHYVETMRHIPVLDADVYAREAVQPGSPVLEDIIDRYGSGILQRDGQVDRRRLGEIVFSTPAELHWLETRIHPIVRDRLQQEIERLDPDHTPVIMLVIPLLFEARMTDLVNEVWVVYCSPQQQLERIMMRDHLPKEQAQARIRSQLSIERKLSKADVRLDNSSSAEFLFRQVDAALNNPRYWANPESYP